MGEQSAEQKERHPEGQKKGPPIFLPAENTLEGSDEEECSQGETNHGD